MIADTTFLIDLMTGNPDAKQKAAELIARDESVHITSVSIFELHIGIAYGLRQEQETSKVAALVAAQETIPFDESAAKAAGKIQGKFMLEGKRMGIQDAMIAGIATTHKETVLTRNIKDFQKTNVKIETY